MLDIYAGDNALKTIQEQGIKQELFTAMLGASGGPKWFTLFGLDKYLFGEFFKDRSTPLNLIGSSAGAFRFGALAQNNPVDAITRLATIYSETVYSDKVDIKEITEKAIRLLNTVYGKNGINEIIHNKVFQAHFIVTKCHGLTSFESKPLQGLGLIASMLLNSVDRKLLRHQYQRFVYHHPNSNINISDDCNFSTRYHPLTESNLKAALLASGSIPLVMEGVKNIPNSPKGMYRDGGIIDYHFDVNISAQDPSKEAASSNNNTKDNLILYPHFNACPKAGWFDKNLKRQVKEKHYDNVVMLSPSNEFINSLPYQKIPDRKDFTEMDATTRIKYWQTVLQKSEQLAENFAEKVHTNDLSEIRTFQY